MSCEELKSLQQGVYHTLSESRWKKFIEGKGFQRCFENLRNDNRKLRIKFDGYGDYKVKLKYSNSRLNYYTDEYGGYD